MSAAALHWTIFGALLLAATVCQVAATPAGRKALDDEEVQIVTTTGFPTAKQDDDLEKLFRENLEPDLADWADKKLSVDLIVRKGRQLAALYPEIVRVIMVYRNQVLMPFNNVSSADRCDQPCSKPLEKLQKELQRTANMYGLPDCIFAVNTGDNQERLCPRDISACAFPLFSFIKHVADADIAAPSMTYADFPQYALPWESKADKAFWRGSNSCRGYHHGFSRCSRSWLAYKSAFKGMSNLTDVGLVDGADASELDEEWGKTSGPKPIPKAAYVSLKEHARYRYLLHLDGGSANTRLHSLMHVNSVLLKQRSPYIEWYYRSLKPGVHMEEFWVKGRDDLYEVLADLQQRAEKQPEAVAEMVRASMDFAARHTSMSARALYWRRALTAYSTLVSDMLDGTKQLFGKMNATWPAYN